MHPRAIIFGLFDFHDVVAIATERKHMSGTTSAMSQSVVESHGVSLTD